MFVFALIEDVRELCLYEQLYRKYRADMFRIAYSVLHDEQQAEDAVAEAYINVAKKIKKISGLSCNKQHDYLVVIIRNVAIDIYRQRKQVVPLEVIEALPDTVLTDDVAIGKLGYENIMQAIEQLPDKYRDVLKLRCLYHHSPDEVGKLLGISANTVNQQFARAKVKLLEILRKEGISQNGK